MNQIKGSRLFVDMSASQVRKRLKGVGYGVRKVESAGRNQAVIIHTATGDHRRELERMFAGYLTAMPDAWDETEPPVDDLPAPSDPE